PLSWACTVIQSSRRIPVNRPSAPSNSSAVRSMDETILLVDDSTEMSELLKHILAETGYRVIAARNGEHALEELARHSAPLDLLLTDVNIPVMSGTELYDRLRDWYPGLR